MTIMYNTDIIAAHLTPDRKIGFLHTERRKMRI